MPAEHVWVVGGVIADDPTIPRDRRRYHVTRDCPGLASAISGFQSDDGLGQVHRIPVAEARDDGASPCGRCCPK